MSFFRNWFYLYIKPTLAETVFEEHIARLGEPYRAQYPFPSLHRVVDFVLHRRKVVIEVDGASHLVENQRRKDLTTSIAMEKLGWSVLRFTNEEVMAAGFKLTHEVLDHKLTTRPTLAELETLLGQLPEPVAKPRKRKRGSAPKKAKKPS